MNLHCTPLGYVPNSKRTYSDAGPSLMKANPWMLSFINIGHALDHLAMLIFPTVVLALSRELNQSYAELLPLAVGGFVAFGACSIPAGYLGDRWSMWGNYNLGVDRSSGPPFTYNFGFAYAF